MHAHEVWVLLVLLASWTQLPPEQDIAEGYEVIELFAGKSRIAKLAHSIGLQAAAHDIMFDQDFTTKKKSKSAMDINEPAGFLLPGFEVY